MSKNNIDNVSLSIGGGNNNNISENKFNIEDNSIHDNIINIVNGNTINVPDKIDRPCLEKYYNERKNSHGKTRIYRFYGYLTGATRIVKSKGKTLTKVLNVITSDGVYVDDHIWLDTQPKKYMKEYNNQRKEKGTLTGFVEFEGYVDSYIRQNGTVSSEIKIVSPITFHKDQLDVIFKTAYNLIEDNKLLIYSKYTREKLFDLIDILQKELNDLLGYYGENFIFFYIINLLFINTAKENLYKNKIARIPMSEKVLRQIIQTIAALIYKLDSSESVNLKGILKYITNLVNVLQDIENYKDRSDDFNNFCIHELGISENGRRSENIWDNVINRKRNFGENPNPFNLSKDEISLQTWMVIYDYI